MSLLRSALSRQYDRTMREAYAFARSSASDIPTGCVLDCGAGRGRERVATFGRHIDAPGFEYRGIEWSPDLAAQGKADGLDIIQEDLNRKLPLVSGSIDCVIAYSVLEHLLMPCSFLSECHRVLRAGGRLVLLTPNISTYFTALQVLAGRMPSSGPHPDSNWLIESSEPPKVSTIRRDDVSMDTPQHRHLVVFSFQALHRFLIGSGFSVTAARGFGYYPIPIWMQPMFERLDRQHCHQMVFVCERRPD